MVNYFIPSHQSGGKVKNTETPNTEFEPKEKVQCPRKYEISERKYLCTVIFVIVLAFLIGRDLVVVMNNCFHGLYFV